MIFDDISHLNQSRILNIYMEKEFNLLKTPLKRTDLKENEHSKNCNFTEDERNLQNDDKTQNWNYTGKC